MPDMSGIEAMQVIRTEFPQAAIIVLTTYRGDVHVTNALRNGARAFLLKSTLRNELRDTIRAVHAGRFVLSPEAASALAEHAADSELSPRELQVLRAAVRGYANKTIGVELGISEDTVKVHMNEHLCQTRGQRSNAGGDGRHRSGAGAALSARWPSGELVQVVVRHLQLLRHPDEVRNRRRLHFLHDLAAVNLQGELADTEFRGRLLVAQAAHHQAQDPGARGSSNWHSAAVATPPWPAAPACCCRGLWPPLSPPTGRSARKGSSKNPTRPTSSPAPSRETSDLPVANTTGRIGRGDLSQEIQAIHIGQIDIRDHAPWRIRLGVAQIFAGRCKGQDLWKSSPDECAQAAAYAGIAVQNKDN